MECVIHVHLKIPPVADNKHHIVDKKQHDQPRKSDHHILDALCKDILESKKEPPSAVLLL
ncbi:hypothetical protein DPMN_121608 [Dreissena polymorpha]|uniref:Uncharacterized protein n=1 Tax=Dreissena polymorpha TaxID=45954 RepID=A0A9D4GQW4_DREPO|nr:hypothetical protein DPMN_121608 [Dreissena polymorpha]